MTLTIFWKGGDFMSIEQLRSPKPESVTGLNNSTFPESPGGGAEATEQLPTVASATETPVTETPVFNIPTAFEIATIDPGRFRAVSTQDWEGGIQVIRTGLPDSYSNKANNKS